MGFMLPIVMRQQPVHVAPEVQRAIMVGMITFMTLLMVLLPAIFLFFYSRKSVRATCLAARGAQAGVPVAARTSAAELPVPLAILGVWEAFGALAVFAILFMQVTLVFGVVLHGAAAVLVLLAHSILSGYAAWSIIRQKLIGWNIALFKAAFWTISMVVSYLRHPDLLQLFREIGSGNQVFRVYEQVPQLLPSIMAGSIVLMTALLVFLLICEEVLLPGRAGVAFSRRKGTMGSCLT
jgi:hypothetical protein